MYTKSVFLALVALVGLSAAHPHTKQTRNAIVELPAEIELPVANYYFNNDGAWVADVGNFSFKGTVNGLDKIEETINYNCTSKDVAFSYLVPSVTVKGVYHADAGFYFGVAGSETVVGQEDYVVNATNFRITITGYLAESSFVCVIKSFAVATEGSLDLFEGRDNLRVYGFDGLLADSAERTELLDEFKDTFWRYIKQALGDSLENLLNQALSKYNLDQFATQIQANC